MFQLRGKDGLGRGQRWLSSGLHAPVVGLIYWLISACPSPGFGADEPASGPPTATTAGFGLAPAAPAHKEAAIEFLPQPTGKEADILAALEERTSLEFSNAPLINVVGDLKDATRHIE